MVQRIVFLQRSRAKRFDQTRVVVDHIACICCGLSNQDNSTDGLLNMKCRCEFRSCPYWNENMHHGILKLKFKDSKTSEVDY